MNGNKKLHKSLQFHNPPVKQTPKQTNKILCGVA